MSKFFLKRLTILYIIVSILDGIFLLTWANSPEDILKQESDANISNYSQTNQTETINEYNLGGECHENGEGTLSLPDLWDQLEAAENALNYREAIEIRKEIILIGCDNEYFWSGLPALHLKLNDFKGAITALEAMYKNRFLVVETYFDPIEAKEYFRCDEKAYLLFKKLKESNEFINSNLAREMKENKIRHLKRVKAALNKLNNLAITPPKSYIAEGAEAFRVHGPYPPIKELIANDKVTIYEIPNGAKITGKAIKGEKVIIKSGETHVIPTPLIVLYDFEFQYTDVTLKNGDIIFKLDCPGEEGACRYWKDGHEFIEEICVVEYYPFKDNRFAVAEYIYPEHNDESISWIQIQLPNGSYGWTREIDKFEASISENDL